MEFKEILDKKLDKNIIALGSRKGSLLTIDINDITSVVITGETGTGKSVMVKQIIKQLTNNYISDDLRFILIDTTGVELSEYKDTDYSLLTAMNDLDKSQEVLFKVLEEIDRRKKLIEDNNVDSIDDYNYYCDKKVPRLLVVLEDNKSLLNKEDVSNMTVKILNELNSNLNILFILTTNNVYNDLFESSINNDSNIYITFDHADSESAEQANMPFSNDLLTGKFVVNINGDYEEYNNFEDDINK